MGSDLNIENRGKAGAVQKENAKLFDPGRANGASKTPLQEEEQNEGTSPVWLKRRSVLFLKNFSPPRLPRIKTAP
jgi:hypothetical protein